MSLSALVLQPLRGGHSLTARLVNHVVATTPVCWPCLDANIHPPLASSRANHPMVGVFRSFLLAQNRSLLEDVREMLCADALVTSRSSMSFLTFAHTRASVFFVPSPCGKGSFRRMKNSPVKATLDNTTLLLLERPHAEVRLSFVRHVSPEPIVGLNCCPRLVNFFFSAVSSDHNSCACRDDQLDSAKLAP